MEPNVRVALGAAVFACCGSLPGVAGATDGPQSFDPVVVTATRTQQTLSATLAPTTVITRDEIEQRQPASLMDLLAATPGVARSNSGGLGKAGSVFMRGSSGSQVLVLVDGLRIGSVSGGSVPLPYIPLAQIERIEIVRGPFSSLYGADAVAGVIQIFLRHEPGSFTPNFKASIGSYQTRKLDAGFSASGERGWIAVQASHTKTRGINACRVGAGDVPAGCFANQPDRDGFHDNAVSVHGSYRFSPQWTVDAMAFRSQGASEYDGTIVDSDDFSVQVVGGQLHYRPAEQVEISLRVGSTTDFATAFLGDVQGSHYDSRRTLGSLQLDAPLLGGLFTGGYDWQRQELASNTHFASTERSNRGLFAQWQRHFGAFSVQLNARHDDNSQYGDESTGSILWGWRFSDQLRLTAGYGTAFRAPTFNDLYFPGYGNPELQPEQSRSVQLGLRATPTWGHWSLSAYRKTVDNLITLDFATFTPKNVGQARITGLEGVIGARLGAWDVRAMATLMRARDQTAGAATEGNQLPRRPEHSLRLDVDRQLGRFSLGATWSVASRRYDGIGNRHPLGGYALVDLRAGWQLVPDWHLQLALNNAFDKHYETAWYFNQPGRNAMLTLRYNPGP